MSEFLNKNDYSVTAFSGYGFLCKYSYVGNLQAFCAFLDQHERFNNWVVINVYVRRSGRFIGQFKKGSFIPPKPR